MMALLMVGAFGVLGTSIMSFQNTANQGKNISLSRSVVNAISNEIRNATSVTIPSAPTNADVAASTLTYVASDASNKQITMGTGSNANNVLINNLDNGTSVVYGQSHIQAGSLRFTRPWDNTLTAAQNKRVFKVEMIFQSSTNSTTTPVSTVITALNGL